MEININIDNNGSIITYASNKNMNKYVNFKEIKSYLLRETKNINRVRIIDNKIILETNDFRLNINNYKNNINSTLDLIIEKAKIIKNKERREYLKKQKIKRIKTFTEVAIISLGIIATNALAENIKTDNIIIDKSFEDVEIVVENNYSVNMLEETKESIEYINTTNNVIEKNEIEFNIDYESRIDTEKFQVTKAYYNEIITNISKEYGIDPQIMLAIATQESGIHRTEENGPAMGLMQIELSVWNNKSITGYNFEKSSYETYDITIEKLKDLEFNIRVACMHFQNCLENSNYNIPVAIQMYNYGYGNIEKIFKTYYNVENINLKEAIKNSEDNWINCRNIIEEGDNEYLEHIFSYIENPEEIKCISPTNNDVTSYRINNNIKIL